VILQDSRSPGIFEKKKSRTFQKAWERWNLHGTEELFWSYLGLAQREAPTAPKAALRQRPVQHREVSPPSLAAQVPPTPPTSHPMHMHQYHAQVPPTPPTSHPTHMHQYHAQVPPTPPTSHPTHMHEYHAQVPPTPPTSHPMHMHQYHSDIATELSSASHNMLSVNY